MGSDSRVSMSAVESSPYLSLDELGRVVSGDGEVTLVEFGVPTGCERCDRMRGPIDALANDPQQPLAVRRVNLRQYPALAWEFGVTVCPSYVAFRDGQEVFRAAHPTSADLIASGLEEALHASSAEPTTLAVQ